MTIPQYIKEALIENQKVVVPNLGTFTTEYQPAEIKNNGSILLPPNQKISFDGSSYSSDFDSLSDFMDGKEDKSKMEIEEEIETFVNDLKDQVASYGRYILPELGHFRKDTDGQTSFIQYDEAILEEHSYGLPKLTAIPLMPVDDDDDDTPTMELATEEEMDGKKKKKSSLILWLILVPVFLMGGAVAYLFIDKEASAAVKALISGQSKYNRAELNKEEATDESGEQNETAEESTENQESTPEEGEAPEATEETTPIEEAASPTPTPAANADALVASAPSDRYYLIIGSFGDEAGAIKAVKKNRANGYTSSKVVTADGKFRVSIDDFPSKEEADSGQGSYKGTFKGVWIYKY